jgi:SAM-dependent methyltransferase
MAVLAPGTLLQLLFLEERLRRLPAGKFVEIGPGAGDLTHLLLQRGWRGRSYDLDAKTIDALEKRFGAEIEAGRFTPIDGDYLSVTPKGPDDTVDLIISCMVLEHLDEEGQRAFMRNSAMWLRQGGTMITLVPGSPAHWGIEDDIAGHFRRYTRASIRELGADTGWNVIHMAGLTFPISNWLLPISNYLVNRSEGSKLMLSPLERTKESGRRNVFFKTSFPPVLALLINRITLFPLHLLQKFFAASEEALVIYFEARPNSYGSRGG